MGPYSYLALNIGSVAVPLIASFYPKHSFFKQWHAFFKANLIVALIFILWDIYFTKIGVWGFNDAYLSGIYLSNLPLEEVLFFICIPFACTFTYFSLGYFFKFSPPSKLFLRLLALAAILCVIVAVVNYQRVYTATAFLSAAMFLGVIWRKKWTGVKLFLTSFTICLLPFYIVNGILSGTGIQEQVVWYNDFENLGLRILTIPLDDHLDSLALQGFNVFLFDYFKGKDQN